MQASPSSEPYTEPHSTERDTLVDQRASRRVSKLRRYAIIGVIGVVLISALLIAVLVVDTKKAESSNDNEAESCTELGPGTMYEDIMTAQATWVVLYAEKGRLLCRSDVARVANQNAINSASAWAGGVTGISGTSLNGTLLISLEYLEHMKTYTDAAFECPCADAFFAMCDDKTTRDHCRQGLTETGEKWSSHLSQVLGVQPTIDQFWINYVDSFVDMINTAVSMGVKSADYADARTLMIANAGVFGEAIDTRLRQKTSLSWEAMFHADSVAHSQLLDSKARVGQ